MPGFSTPGDRFLLQIYLPLHMQLLTPAEQRVASYLFTLLRHLTSEPAIVDLPASGTIEQRQLRQKIRLLQQENSVLRQELNRFRRHFEQFGVTPP